MKILKNSGDTFFKRIDINIIVAKSLHLGKPYHRSIACLCTKNQESPHSQSAQLPSVFNKFALEPVFPSYSF